ncbi:hypothetical protein AB0M34_11770 [Nocardia sp. NPDC050193]
MSGYAPGPPQQPHRGWVRELVASTVVTGVLFSAQAAAHVGLGEGPITAVASTVVVVAVLAVCAGLTRDRRLTVNPLVLIAEALREHRTPTSSTGTAARVSAQIGGALAAAAVLAAVCALARVPTPTTAAPDEIGVLAEITAAAATVVVFTCAASRPGLLAGPGYLAAAAAAIFGVAGAGFAGNPALTAAAVLHGLDPAAALATAVLQFGGCLIGYGILTARQPANR